ncbi:MAG: CerR family C-terminal domain-containing protein [Rubrivivax sp.]
MNEAALPTQPYAGVRVADAAPRARLLQSALRLFATQGYTKTSTRELAEAAAVNVAAISYYFGDKAGLYRAAFVEPQGGLHDLSRIGAPGVSLQQALCALYAGFLAPLKQGDAARLCMKLHFREMLEPTGLWEEEITHSIKPMHDALLALLARHFGLPTADVELKRLAVCLCGLGVHLHVGHDVINALAPELNNGADALDRWSERLVMYAQAMIDVEMQRRKTATLGDAASKKGKTP